MEGLMFQKKPSKKKRKRHKASILHEKDGTCYLCVKLNNDYSYKRGLQEHHVFGGVANRPISEAEGLKVYLCLHHHEEGPEAVQNNKENNRLVQQDAQRAFEETHTREEFTKLFGRNYLEE